MNEWLEKKLKERGRGSQSALARAMGVEPHIVTKIVKGERRIQPAEIHIIQRFIGAQIPGLFLRQDNDDFADEPIVIPIDEAERGDDRIHSGDGYMPGHYTAKLPGAFPELDGAAGAGEGQIGEIYSFSLGRETYSSHRVVAEWVIPEQTLRDVMGVTANNTVVMRVHGDSMEPTFRSGDRVFVDISETTFTTDSVYVISDGYGAPKVKRLQYIPFSSPPQLRIISDNPNLETDIVHLSLVKIHGRVAGVVVAK